MRRILQSVIAATTLLLGFGGFTAVAPTAHGVSPLPRECVVSGKTTVGGTLANTTWDLTGRGTCTGDLEGTFFVTLNAVGTSVGKGLCGGLLVQDLDLDVTLTLQNNTTGATTVETQRWTLPLTVYPVAVPFLVSPDSGGLGAGTIFTRIFAQCAPAGVDTSNFVFAYTT
jgi:hypothetical protein